MFFSENLRKHREAQGISAKDFAKLIDIKYTTYTAYENQGREPKYDTLVKIATALHVSIDELMDYKANKPTKLEYWTKWLESLGYSVESHNTELEIKKDGYTIGYVSEKSFLHELELIQSSIDLSLKPSRDYMIAERIKGLLTR